MTYQYWSLILITGVHVVLKKISLRFSSVQIWTELNAQSLQAITKIIQVHHNLLLLL